MLIRRSKPMAATTTTPNSPVKVTTKSAVKVVETPPTRLGRMVQPLRRAVVPNNDMKGKTAISKEEAREKCLEALQIIAISNEQIDRAAENIDASHAVLEAVMRIAKMSVIEDGKMIAKVAESWTNQSRKIDPQKYRIAVTNEQFWNSCTINLKKAAEFLSEREITAISDVVPSTSNGFKLTVSEIKRKR